MDEIPKEVTLDDIEDLTSDVGELKGHDGAGFRLLYREEGLLVPVCVHCDGENEPLIRLRGAERSHLDEMVAELKREHGDPGGDVEMGIVPDCHPLSPVWFSYVKKSRAFVVRCLQCGEEVLQVKNLGARNVN